MDHYRRLSSSLAGTDATHEQFRRPDKAEMKGYARERRRTSGRISPSFGSVTAELLKGICVSGRGKGLSQTSEPNAGAAPASNARLARSVRSELMAWTGDPAGGVGPSEAEVAFGENNGCPACTENALFIRFAFPQAEAMTHGPAAILHHHGA